MILLDPGRRTSGDTVEDELKNATAAPARTDRAFVLSPYEFPYPSADAGEGIYVWCDSGKTAAIVVERA